MKTEENLFENMLLMGDLQNKKGYFKKMQYKSLGYPDFNYFILELKKTKFNAILQGWRYFRYTENY